MIWCIISAGLIYLLSFYFVWLVIHNEYSKNGIWEDLTVGIAELCVTILPFINTICAIKWLNEYPDKTTLYKNYSKFFKIKK